MNIKVYNTISLLKIDITDKKGDTSSIIYLPDEMNQFTYSENLSGILDDIRNIIDRELTDDEKEDIEIKMISFLSAWSESIDKVLDK